jgi:Cu(I)/Ag(I) efflux system membrane protein CusA/SilA
MRQGRTEALSREEITKAVREGTSRRVRPVVMTATSTIVGLLPIMFLSGTGADVMQRIAAPMIGGMLTTTLLSLIGLPVIYCMALEVIESRKRGNSYA